MLEFRLEPAPVEVAGRIGSRWYAGRSNLRAFRNHTPVVRVPPGLFTIRGFPKGPAPASPARKVRHTPVPGASSAYTLHGPPNETFSRHSLLAEA